MVTLTSLMIFAQPNLFPAYFSFVFHLCLLRLIHDHYLVFPCFPTTFSVWLSNDSVVQSNLSDHLNREPPGQLPRPLSRVEKPCLGYAINSGEPRIEPKVGPKQNQTIKVTNQMVQLRQTGWVGDLYEYMMDKKIQLTKNSNQQAVIYLNHKI